MKDLQKQVEDKFPLRGFLRVQIVDGPSGKIVGDSGLIENTITNPGKQDYLAALLGNTTGSKQIGFIAVGTGTEPASGGTALQGECSNSDADKSRKTVTVSVSASTKVRFTATLLSANSHLSTTRTLKNIGLFAHSTSDNIFAGNTYAESSAATNQNVNATYDITF
jgi:hypothetical protein